MWSSSVLVTRKVNNGQPSITVNKLPAKCCPLLPTCRISDDILMCQQIDLSCRQHRVPVYFQASQCVNFFRARAQTGVLPMVKPICLHPCKNPIRDAVCLEWSDSSQPKCGTIVGKVRMMCKRGAGKDRAEGWMFTVQLSPFCWYGTLHNSRNIVNSGLLLITVFCIVPSLAVSERTKSW